MQIFKIEESDTNIRLDKFLKKIFPNATRSLIYKLNRKEKIKVKSDDFEGKFKKRDNEYKLKLNDEVKIFLNDEEFNSLSMLVENKEKNIDSNNKLSKEDIIYEDGDLLVINKNAGINVHPGDHKTKETNIIYQVQDYLGNKYDSLTFKPSLIHRIDRDTSGILMIAKKKDILVKLVNDLKDHKKIIKTYHAVVLGKLSKKEGTITKKLKRIEDAKDENKVQISEDGQTAITHYKLLNEYNVITKDGNIIISELEIYIETGRMHQIRVHMASIGTPILGDKTYGDKKMNSFFKNKFGLNRQLLHASKIEFFHYGRNKTIKLEARLKEDTKSFLKEISK